MMRREHHTHGGHHDVVAVVRERQGLRVGLHPFQLDTARRGDAAARIEELGCEVACGDDGARLGGRDGGVAGPGCDVEDTVACLDFACPDDLGAEAGDQLGRDGRIVPGGPQRAVPSTTDAITFDRGEQNNPRSRSSG